MHVSMYRTSIYELFPDEINCYDFGCYMRIGYYDNNTI